MEQNRKQTPPSVDAWLREAKAAPGAEKIGMYLTHNGTVRATAKAQVREGKETSPVSAMLFDYNEDRVKAAVEATRRMAGIYYVRAWLNRGRLRVGDDLMYVLIGGDIRPHVIDAMQFLVGTLKESCVSEQELP